MPVRPLVRTIQTCRKVQRMQTAILRNSEILAKSRKNYIKMKTRLLKRLRRDVEKYIYVVYDPINRWYIIKDYGLICYPYNEEKEAIARCITKRREHIIDRIVRMRGKKYYKIF